MNVIADGAEEFFGEPPGAGCMVSSEWFGMNTFGKIKHMEKLLEYCYSHAFEMTVTDALLHS